MDVKDNVMLWRTLGAYAMFDEESHQSIPWDKVFQNQRDRVDRAIATRSPPPEERTEEAIVQEASRQLAEVLLAGRMQIHRLHRASVARNRSKDLSLLADVGELAQPYFNFHRTK